MPRIGRLALWFFMLACATPSQPGGSGVVTSGVQVPQGREFDIRVGEEVEIQGSGLTLRLVRVAEDSRCPVDVQCVWAGNATAVLALRTATGTAAEVSVNTTVDPRSSDFAGYRVRMAGLKPAPRSGTKIPDADYVATLEVNRL